MNIGKSSKQVSKEEKSVSGKREKYSIQKQGRDRKIKRSGSIRKDCIGERENKEEERL